VRANRESENMSTRYTISQIKHLTEDKEPHFFTLKTLRFFGQAMRDFKVIHKGERVFILAPAKMGTAPVGYTFREFNPSRGTLDHLPCGDTLQEIEQFIESAD